MKVATTETSKRYVNLWFDPNGGKNDLLWKRLEADEEILQEDGDDDFMESGKGLK